MDIADIAEKESGKKAAATGAEQPAKKVKNNWNSIDLSRALLKFRLSKVALRVALCVHSHQGFCKTGWNGHYLFREDHMQEETGFVKKDDGKKIRAGLDELESVNAIKVTRIKEKGKWIGKVIEWNFDYKSWEKKKNKSEPVENPPVENPPVENPPVENPPVENPPVENPPVENPPVENHPVIRIIDNRKDYTDPKDYTESPKDDTSLKDDTKRGGAAAEPHGPAFSESAPKKTGSTGKAQEQPRPFMAADYSEEDPAQEKPKKKPKGKGKAAGEIEIPEVEEIKSYIAGYIQENHKKGVHSYIWTDWELTETAKDIQAAIPKYKWKDWQHGARNWIRNSKPVAFKPKMTDPARDTRNQPQRRKSYEHLKEHKGAALEAESRTITQN